jgi:gliding motility-associated-like protein
LAGLSNTQINTILCSSNKSLTTIIIFCVFCFSNTFGQHVQPSCPNSDFELGNFDNWQGFYGTFNNPAENQGFITSVGYPRHLIISAPGTQDANTCYALTTVPPNESYCARLGNDSIGAKAEQLRYTLTVTDESNLFIYKYAVVFQDPDHSPEDQPSFTIEVTDQTGAVFDSACGYYYVYPHPGIPGWNVCNAYQLPVLWKDWTTVGLDLTPYLGQTITIVFTTRDCLIGGHYGYAYLSTACSKLEILVSYCTYSGQATLTAPPGFSYAWSNGGTTQSITIIDPGFGKLDSCTLTAVNGCKATIHALINPTNINADFSFVPNKPNIEVPFYDQSVINQNSIVNWEWDFGDGSPTMSNIPNPIHIFTNQGNYNVRLVVSSADGCMDTINKLVRIEAPATLWFPNSFTPNGDGLNDVFRPTALNVGSYRMTIYNRWGKFMFETNDLEVGWTGNLSNEPCPPEVYVYVVTFELLDIKEIKTATGNFTLIR